LFGLNGFAALRAEFIGPLQGVAAGRTKTTGPFLALAAAVGD